MLHKTLESYRLGNSYDEPQEHPDGPLWLLTLDEFWSLPENTLLEMANGKTYYKHELDPSADHRGLTPFGVRGRKDD